MSAARSYLDSVNDMIDAIDKIADFTDGIVYEEFVLDDRTVYAVIHALEILGEATKQLPDEVYEQYPDIPWRSIAGMRDKLIHSYFSINRAIIWQTIQDDLPQLYPVLIEMAQSAI